MIGAVGRVGRAVGGSGRLAAALASVAPMSFPAQGAAYDFDWTHELDPVAPYRTIPPHSGVQPIGSNTMPLLYRQMITQVPHYIENKDGSLLLTPATSPRRSNKGLFSYNGQWNRVAAPRNLTSTSWTKTNATASKDQVGRDGVANTGCLLTFTADGGSISQAITIASGAPRRVLFDIKRVSGADPIEWSIDGGATWTSYTLTGNRWNGWDRVRGPIHTSENPTLTIRGKAGNSFVTDFIHLSEVRDWPSLTSDIHDTHRMDPNTGVGKDRIHHTTTTNGGGPSGEDGINILRSQQTQGMFTSFTYMSANAIMAVLGGIMINTFVSPPSVTVQNQQSAIELVTAPLKLDPGDQSALNKLMYFRTPAELRVAVNGVIYRTANMEPIGTAITHDFATNGSGTALEGIVKRLVWFDDSRVPSDAEMILWTT